MGWSGYWKQGILSGPSKVYIYDGQNTREWWLQCHSLSWLHACVVVTRPRSTRFFLNKHLGTPIEELEKLFSTFRDLSHHNMHRCVTTDYWWENGLEISIIYHNSKFVFHQHCSWNEILNTSLCGFRERFVADVCTWTLIAWSTISGWLRLISFKWGKYLHLLYDLCVVLWKIRAYVQWQLGLG